MATPTQLRSRIRGLTGLASRDVTLLLGRVRDAAEAEVALRDVLPALIDTYGQAAAVVATEWYDDLRAKKDIKGGFRAVPADIRDSGSQALVGWASSEANTLDTLGVRVIGGMQRRIADFARQSVMESSIFDPSAQGWQRVSQGGCSQGFCDMLAGRGAVYSEESADFASHDHCQCYAVPAFEGEARPVKPYTPTLRNVTDKDRARVREYLRTRTH